jgi:predicted alpha/beta hydrolase
MTRDFEFDTVGGRQSGVLHGPAKAPWAIVIAPALGIRASYYQKLVDGLVARGLAAAAIDSPGFGNSPIRAGWRQNWGYRELVAQWVNACAAIHPWHPRLALLGHSIGGQTALMAGGQSVPGLEAVITVASGVPWWRAWSGMEAVKVRAGIEVCAAAATLCGHLPGKRLGFGGREARRLTQQWAKAGRSGQYRFRGFDGDALLARPGPPVLSIGLDGDDWAPPKAIDAILARITARPVHRERWTDAPHGGNHNRWPSQPAHVVERTLTFLSNLEAA